MTEKEWATSGAPGLMLEHSWEGASERKKRLFGCACCYRAWHLLSDPKSKTAVCVAECFADGVSSAESLATAYRAAESVVSNFRGEISTSHEWHGAMQACCDVASDPYRAYSIWRDIANTLLRAGAKWHAELAGICDLLRDMFGYPFRPVTVDSAWLTSDVLALARGIYDEKAFDRMPILADALQDAGCDSEEVLNHCRGPGPHVRGCWVVDLVLGKQ
jgi:hypothetical protein